MSPPYALATPAAASSADAAVVLEMLPAAERTTMAKVENLLVRITSRAASVSSAIDHPSGIGR